MSVLIGRVLGTQALADAHSELDSSPLLSTRNHNTATLTFKPAVGAQVAIALTGGELNYFELDAMGQLAEMEKKEMQCEVAAMDVGPLPPARQRSRFLAVCSVDSTIRVLSLDPADTMTVRPSVSTTAVYLKSTTIYPNSLVSKGKCSWVTTLAVELRILKFEVKLTRLR